MLGPLPTDAAIFVAGHRGLVGSAIERTLRRAGFQNIQTATRSDLDLRCQRAVHRWFELRRPGYVFHAAGTVGGILANSQRPAEFLYDNLLMHVNVIEAARQSGVQRLLYLGSSCIYPRECPQPIKEEYLLSGPLEETNEAYAVAKIAGIQMCRTYRRQYGCDFFSVMPTNLYGENDNFDLHNSHVLPALIRKFHEAKQNGLPTVDVWGTGMARREFLHVDDLADACLFLMQNYAAGEHINVGTGSDVTICELAEMLREVIYPEANLAFDTTKPDGTPRKQLDVARLHELGWRHAISLREGIEQTYRWYRENLGASRPIRKAS